MKKNLILFALFFALSAVSYKSVDRDLHVPSASSAYPYWPSYQFLEVNQLKQIKAQKWINKEHVIDGWDWSLPDFVEPSLRSMVGLQRTFRLEDAYQPLNLKFKSNATAVLWVKWRDLEPSMGEFNFQPLIDRIKQANSLDMKVLLRLLCHSKTRGTGNDLKEGDAPLWLEDLGVNLLPQERYRGNLNFDPSHPEFHKRYLILIDELAQSGIPEMVSAAYVGYASPTYGDEGIGPYGERNGAANDTVRYVRERLDAWGNAFKGMEHKVFMGGFSDYGIKNGFGVRRGFVEMYLYNIPNGELGQYIDENGYLTVDEEAPVMKYNCFNGEENEEYGAIWATRERENRFGTTTASFPYRYFMSTLRAIQMRCNYVLTRGHVIPEMLPFLSLELGRTVGNTPDVWTFLSTSYLKGRTYNQHDYKVRVQSEKEKAAGIETKNFERWLYQRDAEGYETQPAVKIKQPIEMWMVQPGKYYDYIARSGKQIGFDIDDRWTSRTKNSALKVTYFDNYKGELKLLFNKGENAKRLSLKGDKKLKTATFLVSNIESNSMDHGYDFTLEAGGQTEKIVVSMVRVVDTNQKKNP